MAMLLGEGWQFFLAATVPRLPPRTHSLKDLFGR